MSALSVLSIGPKFGDYALWQGDTILLKGSQEELFSIKNVMDESEQQKANSEWREAHKQKMLTMLTTPGSGNTPEEAEQFLKKTMPYLY